MNRIGPWLRDLIDYVVALFHHWIAFVTGSVVTAALTLFAGLWPKVPVRTPYFAVLVFLAGVLTAGFYAWREERVAKIIQLSIEYEPATLPFYQEFPSVFCTTRVFRVAVLRISAHRERADRNIVNSRIGGT